MNEFQERLSVEVSSRRRTCLTPFSYMLMIVFMISMCLSAGNANGLYLKQNVSSAATTSSSNIRHWRHLAQPAQLDRTKQHHPFDDYDQPDGKPAGLSNNKSLLNRLPSSVVIEAGSEDDEENNYNTDEELANELASSPEEPPLENQTIKFGSATKQPVFIHRHHDQTSPASKQPVKATNRFESPDRTVQRVNTEEDSRRLEATTSLKQSNNAEQTALEINSTNLISSLFSHIDKQWNFAEVILIIVISAILNLVTIVGNIMVLISFKMDRS